jgi:hypothetical protein
MIDSAAVIAAMNAYKTHLKEKGQAHKAAAVEHCIAIIRRL